MANIYSHSSAAHYACAAHHATAPAATAPAPAPHGHWGRPPGHGCVAAHAGRRHGVSHSWGGALVGIIISTPTSAALPLPPPPPPAVLLLAPPLSPGCTPVEEHYY
ncbi:hypothetical protein GB937_010272 [Aspergillus fischeri]|nr:hypothetical protein GB937_010272 [Aspergillus fischeri]